MVAGVTAGLAESNGSLPSGLWFTSPAGWLPRTGISSGTLRSVIDYGIPLPLTLDLRPWLSIPASYNNDQYTCKHWCQRSVGIVETDGRTDTWRTHYFARWRGRQQLQHYENRPVDGHRTDALSHTEVAFTPDAVPRATLRRFHRSMPHSAAPHRASGPIYT